jgi:hypothetical protein
MDRIQLSNELSDARKEQKKNNAQKQEANFLRFLRTTERPQNYATLKIIGKGAFGEVKLVQRKRDQKIYALKSLVKTEMVCHLLRLHRRPPPTNTPYSTKKTNSHTSALSATFSPMQRARGSSSCTPLSRTQHSSTCSWSSCLVVT